MKYNPIINGISESEDRQVDNFETTMKNCINKNLGVEGDRECHNVHRLKLRVDRKPPNIIAKFTKYSDSEKVRTSSFEIQQYSAEISARRKEIIPQMQALKREGRQGVRLVMHSIESATTPGWSDRSASHTCLYGASASSSYNVPNCTVLCTDGTTIRATGSSGKIGSRKQ